MAVSPDGNQIILGQYSVRPAAAANVYDTATGTLIRSLAMEAESIYSITVTSDNKYLWCGASNGFVREFELATGKQRRSHQVRLFTSSTVLVSHPSL